MIYDSILDTIGRTPVVKLHRLAPKHVELYVKVEAFNPAGSVKTASRWRSFSTPSSAARSSPARP